MRSLIVDVQQAVEQAARNSYGRLVAFLCARSHNVADAEDALGDALRAALETWPRAGIPDKPEAWLLTTARRRQVEVHRHAQVVTAAQPALLAALEEAQSIVDNHEVVLPDERLKLLFICAHPAIDSGARTPLMLQVVLGLDAARIASAFLVRPSAMGQRLTRAKTKIREARIPFAVPDNKALPERLEAVLNAIYAAYGSGWDDVAGADPRRKGLAVEAIGLGRLLSQLLPQEPEAMGLLALMLHCEARRTGRRNSSGEYVPLSEQDVRCWSRPMMEEAEQYLSQAATCRQPGRFQLEAAIQSVHAQRARTGHTDWEAIALLYQGLVRLSPAIGALVGRAAACSARDAATAWKLLEQIPPQEVKNYQPYWALAAHLLKRLQRGEEARAAYSRAIGLCDDPAMRAYLIGRSESIG